MRHARQNPPASNRTSVGHALSQPVASLHDVTKRYGSTLALNDFTLEIHPGQVVALLGPNGAGKTTSVNLMLGLQRPTSGHVELFGGNPQDAYSRTRVGVMLQLSGVPETLTVREHIDVFAAYYPSPLPMHELLELTNLRGLEDRPYGKLSGGQRQRLHLALALCGNPDLLFLDEPTTGLDITSRRALWDAVRSFTSSGRTVVLTTHYLEEVDALADHVVVIDKGTILAEGTPSEIKAVVAGTRIRCITRLEPQTLQNLPGVQTVTREGTATEILASHAEPVVLELLQRDPTLHGLEVGGARLEEAFLALTNRNTPLGKGFSA